MRKILCLLFVAMLTNFAAFSQTRSITGKVTDQSGAPVSFATVSIKGTKTAVVSTAEGDFAIKAKTGDVLVVTAVGLESTEMTVGSGDVVNITAKRTASDLSEVVVTTAFNVKRDQRTTPYSAQVIKNEALNIIPQTNINDALAGKIAGVQVRGQSGTKLDGQSFARVRGGLLLGGDVGVIYVVDGTIVPGYDVNPADVDNLTVLKGANATALFGSRAANGAIVITTKTGQNGKSTIRVNQGVTFDRPSILPKLQNSYAGGGSADLTPFTWVDGMPEEWKALDGKSFPDYTDDASWGPKMEGQEYIPWYAWVPGTKYSFKTARLTPQPDNIRDFWETGVNSNTAVSFDKGGQGYKFRLNYSKQYVQGLIPNSGLDRNVISTDGSIDVNKFITVGANITFNTAKINGEFSDGYANNTSGNFGQWNHRDLDMNIMRELRGLRTPIGTMASWNWASNPDGYDPANPRGFYSGNYWYNFYGYMDELDRTVRRDRYYGNAYIKINPINHLSLKGTIRREKESDYFENKVSSLLERSGSQTGNLASYATGNFYIDEVNYEAIATYNNTFLHNDLGVNLLAGGNIQTYLLKSNSANTNQGLIVPDLFAISNSKATPSVGNGRLERRINSWFGSADFEYRKFISATFAMRQDWSSTLPAGNNKLSYPSAGLSFIPSELFKSSMPSWFTFAKLYASWGKKPLTLEIYQNNFLYDIQQNQWNGNFLTTTPGTIPDPTLKGSLITSYEAGVDLRFIKNKLGVLINYYNETAADQPVGVSISGVSGFTTRIVNASTVKRTGIEVTINGNAISTKNFNWTLTKTFGWLINNPVTKIIEGQDRLLLGAGAFGTRYARAFQEVNKDWGQLIGGGFSTNEQGQKKINPNTGLYVSGDPNYHWGSIVPKITGGFQSLMTYKDFTLNLSLDYQFGGKFFSLTESWGMFSGLLDYTAVTNDRGKNVRDPLSEGGGVRVTGVSSVDGKTPIDTYVDGFTYFHQFYASSIAAPFVHSLSFVKMREISVGYNLPVQRWGLTSKWCKAANIAVISRNPFMIYRETQNFDPSEISDIYGENGQLPPVRSIGFNLSFTF